MSATIRKLLLGACVFGFFTLPLAACDNTESHSKKTTTTVRDTDEGKTKTTETTEKKVEHQPK